jgi:hypothetical protein
LPPGTTSLDRTAATGLLAEVGSRSFVSTLVRLAEERAGNTPLHSEVAEVIREHDAFDVDVEDLFLMSRAASDPVTPLLIQWIVGQVPHDDLVARLDRFLVSDDPAEREAVVQLIRAADSLRGDLLPGFGAGPELIEEDLPEAMPPDELPAEDAAPPDDVLAEANGGRGDDVLAEANGGGQEAEPPGERGLEEEEAEAPGGEEPRWLQAEVGDPGSSRDDKRKAFRADAPNEVSVLVDVVRDDDALVAVGPTAAASIDAHVEAGVTTVLTVLFQVPALHEAQTATIELPPQGSSRVATFTFTAPPVSQRVDAMITVLHGNRAIQAATLSGFSLQDPIQVPPGFEATFRFEPIRPGTAGLEDRQPFDAAVVARGGATGPGAAGFSDGVAVAFDDEKLGPVVDRVRKALRRLADTAAAFADGLRAQASVDLLRELAFQGRDLHRLLGEPLERARPGAPLERIQVVVTDTDSFIPVEFVYDFPTPTETSTLCPNAEEALAEGRCDPANHPPGDRPGTSSVVCPLGFWALRKVIERQVVGTGEEDLGGRDFSIRAEVTAERQALDTLTHAVVAWSERVNLGVPGQSDALVAALTELTADRATAVHTWEEWLDAVRQDAPPLLVLLSHTVTTQGTLALEIGPDGADGSRTKRQELAPEFVKRDGDGRPMVLLLGCDTAVDKEEPESFVAGFRGAGAAVVVGTISPVLGENAVPVAVALLGELRRAVEDPGPDGVATFGEAMLGVRRTLVGKGHLTALCLTAVGDADWRLSPAGG